MKQRACFGHEFSDRYANAHMRSMKAEFKSGAGPARASGTGAGYPASPSLATPGNATLQQFFQNLTLTSAASAAGQPGTAAASVDGQAVTSAASGEGPPRAPLTEAA